MEKNFKGETRVERILNRVWQKKTFPLSSFQFNSEFPPHPYLPCLSLSLSPVARTDSYALALFLSSSLSLALFSRTNRLLRSRSLSLQHSLSLSPALALSLSLSLACINWSNLSAGSDLSIHRASISGLVLKFAIYSNDEKC